MTRARASVPPKVQAIDLTKGGVLPNDGGFALDCQRDRCRRPPRREEIPCPPSFSKEALSPTGSSPSVADRVARLKERGLSVGLGTILVGEDAPSAGYVRKKHQTARQVGIESYHRELPSSASPDDLIGAVLEYNEDDRVDAYLIQYPLPGGFDYAAAVSAMAPGEGRRRTAPREPGPTGAAGAGAGPGDAGGHPRDAVFHYGIGVEGREVVVVGRGPTLGRPLALLLSQKAPGANAAVTVVHTGVSDMARYSRRADILIAAAGVPGIVTPGDGPRGCGGGQRRHHLEGGSASCPTWPRRSARSPRGSPRASAASGRRRWPCSCATP